MSVHPNDGTPLFKKDSTFIPVAGLDKTVENGTSLMASNFPNFYVKNQGGLLKLIKNDGGLQFAKEATWHLVPSRECSMKLNVYDSL